jgi:hypothetical protein
MELTFNKGNYDQHIDMVNATKEMLNDSIVLRSIKENVDHRIAKSREENSADQELSIILILAVPFIMLFIYINILSGLSWRIAPGILMIVYFIIYYYVTKDSNTEIQLISPGVHDEGPKPLKFLEMKVNYLIAQSIQQKTKLDLLRVFYLLFFPFLCYFLYEVIIKSAPFNNILVGLLLSAIISGVGWYIFFQNDFKALRYSHRQLNDYKKLIHQHYISYSEEE